MKAPPAGKWTWRSVAVWMRSAFRLSESSGVSSGTRPVTACCSTSRATLPVTAGAAIEVPLRDA
jgi:hypothetical protein